MAGLPNCATDCHSRANSDNAYHDAHWSGSGTAADVSCFVCHSQPYLSCNSCHTAGEWEEGYTQTGTDIHEGGRDYKEFPSFRIGVNPAYAEAGGSWSSSLKAHAGEEWILLRHIPVSDDTYDPWGWNSLAFYSMFETWEYTSPHNIRRWTAQTLVDTAAGENCWAQCHYNASDTQIQDLYLTREYLEQEYPEEVTLNQYVTPDFE